MAKILSVKEHSGRLGYKVRSIEDEDSGKFADREPRRWKILPGILVPCDLGRQKSLPCIVGDLPSRYDCFRFYDRVFHFVEEDANVVCSFPVFRKARTPSLS